MNKTLETILTRKSIRKFKNDLISEEDVKLILEAAMQAPSACNQQIWQFILINQKELLNKLSLRHGGITFAKDAPCAILVCGEPKAATLKEYWREDCAAASLNILLAAHSLGIGSTWSGISYDDIASVKNIQALLNIPEQYIPFSLIVLGYPDEDRTTSKRFNANKVHYNQW